MEHTPIPWAASTHDDGSLYIHKAGQDWGDGVIIGTDDAPKDTDVAFIVRAANNHAKLLAALEAVVAAVVPTTLGTNELSMIFRRAREAIEKAQK